MYAKLNVEFFGIQVPENTVEEFLARIRRCLVEEFQPNFEHSLKITTEEHAGFNPGTPTKET